MKFILYRDKGSGEGYKRRRSALHAAKAKDPLWEKFEAVLMAGVKLRAVMVKKSLTSAKAECPSCKVVGALHGRLITGQAAGRHRKSGGAFRMWCDNCPDIRMME